MMKHLAMAFAVAALAVTATAKAQDYPSKPVRIVVGFPPGGLVDVVTRQLTAKMSDSLGQPIIIDNRGGAGGSIATQAVASAPADGYTFFMAFDTHAVNPHIYKKLPYDTFKDFAPVSMVARIPLAFASPASFGPSSIGELVKAAKAKPGAITYGSVGAGSSGHLAAEQFKQAAGVELLHVPFKGGAPAMNALLGEQINLLVFAPTAAIPHIKAGKLKVLAVTGKRRAQVFPNVPTMAEAGYPQLDSGAWIGMVAPAGTPQPIIARMNSELAKAMQDPAIKGKLADQAVELESSTPQEFGAFVRAEHDKWGKLIRDARLNIEQ
jgi:tripartite-type tricarboxylate transporter receptor subunit TctC